MSFFHLLVLLWPLRAGRARIVLHDITLWSAAPQDANNYDACKQLPRSRELLLEGKNDEAQAIMDQSNFGATAGIAVMLLQRYAGFIELLPAIPDAWKPIGSVLGLKGRGNFTVDMDWKDGKVIRYRISCPTPRKLKVKINGILQEIVSLSPNHSLP